MNYVHKKIDSPVGQLSLVGSANGLAAIVWSDDRPLRVRIPHGLEEPDHPILVETERQLNEYFGGTRKVFSVELDFYGGTPFQHQVWQALLAIPYGETCSYSEIARQIGKPTAVRAVGAANGRNPIAIIGPCHRVLGSSGKLTGYAGGLPAKAFLLGLENARVPGSLEPDLLPC